MEKTKLGLSTSILGAAAFLVFHFGGYVAGLLLVGYILIRETDLDLRISAVTALMLSLAFSLVNTLVGLLPNVVGIFESLLYIFDVYLGIEVINDVFNFFYNVISLAKTVIFLLLAVFTLVGKPIRLPFIKKMLGEA